MYYLKGLKRAKSIVRNVSFQYILQNFHIKYIPEEGSSMLLLYTELVNGDLSIYLYTYK